MKLIKEVLAAARHFKVERLFAVCELALCKWSFINDVTEKVDFCNDYMPLFKSSFCQFLNNCDVILLLICHFIM